MITNKSRSDTEPRKQELSSTVNSCEYDGTAGCFVSVIPDTRAMEVLNFWTSQLNLPASAQIPTDIHCTVMYSTTPPSYWTVDPAMQFDADCRALHWWPGHDKVGYLVMELESDDLSAFHRYWKDKGCTPIFPDYRAHITLCTPCPAPSQALLSRLEELNTKIPTAEPRLRALTLSGCEMRNIAMKL
jgi:hypothetical protein